MSTDDHRRTRSARRMYALVLCALCVLCGVRGLPVDRVGAAQATVTFSKDIAPVLFTRCSACHHPGGAAPFSLLSYASAKSRAGLIASATARRFMPPWKADPISGDFIGQPRLSDGDIGLIQRWAETGALEGDPRDLPRLPPIAEGWQLGQPDLIVSPSQAYTLQADGTDVFRIFVVPLPVDRVRYVRGLEFRPGNPKVVHHANIRIDRTRSGTGLRRAAGPFGRLS